MTARTVDLALDENEWLRFASYNSRIINHHQEEVTAYLVSGVGDEAETFLYWTDNVVNEWAEAYDDLATALARMAVLIAAIEEEKFFRHEVSEFPEAWSASLDTFLEG